MEEKEIKQEEIENLPPKITKDNIDPLAETKKGKILLWIRAVLYTMLSSFLISTAAYTLITPNEFTIGGVSGIAILVNIVSDGKIPQSLVLLGLNLPLVTLSFFIVKKRFALLSLLNIGLQSFWMFLWENLPVVQDFQITFNESGTKIFAALAAGICVGTSVALALTIGGSTGGTDIAAVMIQKKINANSIAWTIFGLNCVIIGASLFVFEPTYYADGTIDLGMTLLPIMMAAFETYIESKTNESILNGFQSAREFRIITDKPEEMAQALMRELSRGVSALPATGMYTKDSHTMLVCVVNRRQVATLRRIIKKVDPDSFAVMSNVSQVLGLGFYTDQL